MSANQSTATLNSEPLVELLANPKIQASLATALEKLPSIMENYTELEKTLDFVKNVTKDQDSLHYLMDGLKSDLPDVTLNRDTLNAMLILADKLPKLVQVLTLTEPLIEFAQAVLNDKASLQQLAHSAEDFVHPIKTKVEDGLSMIEEARQRAAMDRTPVSIFSMLKLLKDPNVQYGVHFAQAMLSVLGERKSR